MRFEFYAYEVWMHQDHAILVGWVGKEDIHLGDVFTVLAWLPWLSEPVGAHRVGEPTVTHAVGLRVDGIECYRRPLDFVSSGMSATLKLTGSGRELLRAIDPAARDGQWVLFGERPPS